MKDMGIPNYESYALLLAINNEEEEENNKCCGEVPRILSQRRASCIEYLYSLIESSI